jgi:hypothetical protein
VTTTVEEPKPAASLTPASIKRGVALFDASPTVTAFPDAPPQGGREERESMEGSAVPLRERDRVRGIVIFGAIYVGALLIFAAAFDVLSVVLG